MAAFTQDVAKSPKAQDPGEQQKMQRMLEQRAATATKQYGGVGAAPVTQAPQTDLAQSLAAQQTFEAGDYERRKQAATGAYNIAKAEDTASQDLSEKVRSALYGREQLQGDVATKQRQMDEEFRAKLAAQNQEFSTKAAQMDFTHFKSVADQTDAMANAYNQGILGYQMLDLANKNMLKMSDIEKYFSFIKNDFDNQMKDLQVFGDYQIKTMADKFQAKGHEIASIISGITGLAQTGAKGYQQYDTKTGMFAPSASETGAQ